MYVDGDDVIILYVPVIFTSIATLNIDICFHLLYAFAEILMVKVG
jgi:hypothetical protein